MNIFNWIKKLLFKEEKIELINISDLIQIPGRSYFNDNKDMLLLIDELKEKYYNILSQRKRITTNDINFDNIKDELKMYIDLMLNIIIEDNNISLYYTKTKSKLDNTIDMIKLKLYLKELENMENITIAKLIALKELEKGRRVPHLNRDTLKREIDNLTTTLYLFLGQKRAVRLEIDAYLTNVSIKDEKITQKTLYDKKHEVINYASNFINIEDIKSMPEFNSIYFNHQFNVIALIEKRLEEYVYCNKDKVNDVLGKIEDINIESGNKDELLKKIEEIEKEYFIFYKYGRNIITKEDFYKLYDVKFNVLTRDALNYSYEIDLYTYYNEIENEVYDNIIFKKKEDIFKDRNPIITEMFGNHRKEVIYVLHDYFKNDYVEVFNLLGDDKYIHHSSMALRLLLAFDTKDGLEKFFNLEYYSSLNNIPNSIYKNLIFTFDKKMPLSTILEVMNPKEEDTHNFIELRKLYNFYKVFNLYEINKGSYLYNLNTYRIPEGITSIIFDSKKDNKDNYIYKLIKKNIKGKTVELPSTLISIYGDFFDDVINVSLNNGLYSIGNKALSHIKPKVLYIPSSLSSVYNDSFNLEECEYIIFENFKESNLLSSSILLHPFLSNVFKRNDDIFSEIKYLPRCKNAKIILEDGEKTIRRELDLFKMCNKIAKNGSFKNSSLFEYLSIEEADMLKISKFILNEVEKTKKYKIKSK